MNLHERVLSVLGCRHIDDVLIDAPYDITNEMISTLGISEVVQVKQDIHDGSNEEHDARYKCAQDAGILNTIKAESNFRIGNVIQRIQRNQNAFQAKFERKMKAEQDYIDGIAIGNANSSPRV